MDTKQEKLAESLIELRNIQKDLPCIIIQGSEQLSRTHLDRLLKNGWIQRVMRGWYISAKPGTEGDTTVWYTAFWHFISKFATTKVGQNWCLTAEQSLDLYSGKTTIPKQVIIKSPKGDNNVKNLMYGTTLLMYKGEIPSEVIKEPIYGLNLYTLPEALVYASPNYFHSEEIAARTCLSMINDPSDILKILVNKGASGRAGKLVGAFRNIGNNEVADAIHYSMTNLGYTIREENPFKDLPQRTVIYQKSPYVTRLQLMWENMRETVIKNFPQPPGLKSDIESYLRQVDEKYLEDAYNSLSIEGYRVSAELIEKVRSGNWKPDEEDRAQRDALAARGYYQAFQAVRETINTILKGKNPGEAVRNDHSKWYLQMWMPCVNAGIIREEDLLGYRTSQVYIRKSLHTPLNPDAVRDSMPVLFDLLEKEPHPGVRAILGHFIFVFIHPYMDGNGRIGRFLMNTMLASGGYSWTIIPLEKRQEYMKALETASVNEDISDFSLLIASLMDPHY